MNITYPEMTKILNDLSYLYSNYGEAVSKDDAVQIKAILSISTTIGFEHLSQKQVEFAVRTYKKYENKDLTKKYNEEDNL